MPTLTRADATAILDFVRLPRGKGYVLDFSDRTFSEFFADTFGVDIEDERYALRGTSKGKRLLIYLESVSATSAAALLRRLDERHAELGATEEIVPPDRARAHEIDLFGRVMTRLEANAGQDALDVFEPTDPHPTLEVLVDELRRLIQDDNAPAVLDRLHTYTLFELRAKLTRGGEEVSTNESLQSLFGRYRKRLVASRILHPVTDRALKSMHSVLEQFNAVRNDRSLAHPNLLLPADEARLVLDQVVSVLRFIRSVEPSRHRSRSLS